MSTTIDVICYKSKVLKKNETPLMLRVTKDRKRRYLSLGISINPQHWDFDKNRPRRNYPNKDHILKLVKMPLQDKAMQIISKYADANSPYLFPILSNFHKTDVQKANRVHKVIAKVNKQLKQIGKELNIPIDLTTYVARHSFTTVLKCSGVNTAIISELLGHSSEKVTQIYLDSFENSQIDEVMKNLL